MRRARSRRSPRWHFKSVVGISYVDKGKIYNTDYNDQERKPAFLKIERPPVIKRKFNISETLVDGRTRPILEKSQPLVNDRIRIIIENASPPTINRTFKPPPQIDLRTSDYFWKRNTKRY